MKLFIQRVSEARVSVEGKVVGAIGIGALVLIGITHSDTQQEAVKLVNKLVNLRFFVDEDGKCNKSLLDINGEALVISQFTLYADCTTGRRPSFTDAAPPQIAEPLYNFFIHEVKKHRIHVETGIFGAKMAVSLTNDGPVTILL